jgi:hypothetical protein
MAVASPVGIMLIDSPFRYRRGIGSQFTNRVSSGAGKVHAVSQKLAFAKVTKAKNPISRNLFYQEPKPIS